MIRMAIIFEALDFKVCGVTISGIYLSYEPLKFYHQSKRQKYQRCFLQDASPALTAGVITAIYCYNKIYGPSSWIVSDIKAYIPHYSWHTFTESNAHFLSELFYHLAPIDAGMVLATWALVFLYAFLRRDRMLQLMAFWIVITPLPLDFIQLRGGACLYILLFGWAMIFAKFASDLIMLTSKSSIWLGQGVGVGATTGAIIAGAATNRVRGAAIGAAVGAAASKMSPLIFRVFAT